MDLSDKKTLFIHKSFGDKFPCPPPPPALMPLEEADTVAQCEKNS